MANQEHIDILMPSNTRQRRKGNQKQLIRLISWNEWRKSNPYIKPDLSGADLRGQGQDIIVGSLILAMIGRENLSKQMEIGQYLAETNFFEADLSGADLSGTCLIKANFFRANLSNTNLSRANITGARLYGTIRDGWKIDGIKCDYIFWDEYAEIRTPTDRDFSPGEFEELYKWWR